MAKSYFTIKEILPDDEKLSNILDGAYNLWLEYVNQLYEHEKVWKYYGRAWGWCLVFVKSKKNLLYLTPAENSYTVSFAFSDRAFAVAVQAGFSDELLDLIASGKTNTAGRTFDFKVSNAADADIAKKLLKIKLDNM